MRSSVLRGLRPLLLAPLLALTSACGGGGGGGGGGGPAFNVAVAQQAVLTYANLLHANYGDIHARAQDLQADVVALVTTPSTPLLLAARGRWATIRPFYLQTEMARFYDGPIDRAPDGPEIFMNAWPLDEAHIDYVSGNATAGLINDTVGFPLIDADTIRAQNENGGEANISCGWHAIEFLLWGQDLTLGVPAGQRTFEDFIDGGATAANEGRRRAYLQTLAAMLVADLAEVRDEWAPGTGPYRAELLALAPVTALSRMMTGMGTLAFGELRGERLLVPFTTKLPDDEHSCFSDTTHQDHLNDVIGIRNAWLGSYTSSDGTRNVSGTGLLAVANTTNAALAGQITTILNELVTLLGSPVLEPFESAIQGDDTTPGRQQLQLVMNKLNEFNLAFSTLAAQMGVDITTTI